MGDNLTRDQRSQTMAAIRSKNTRPEMVVRRIAHRLGYRFRLHRCGLPGTPDLVFVGLRKIVNVHGCYWHMHDCRHGRVTPQSNVNYWKTKRNGNVARDRQNLADLLGLGWDVLTIWECQTKDEEKLSNDLARFLGVRIIRPADKSRC